MISIIVVKTCMLGALYYNLDSCKGHRLVGHPDMIGPDYFGGHLLIETNFFSFAELLTWLKHSNRGEVVHSTYYWTMAIVKILL